MNLIILAATVESDEGVRISYCTDREHEIRLSAQKAANWPEFVRAVVGFHPGESLVFDRANWAKIVGKAAAEIGLPAGETDAMIRG